MSIVILGYIDPNTSQHVFSLLGPLLAFLGMAGGVIVTTVVFIRYRIISYFRRASWVERILTVFMAVGVLTGVGAMIWWII